MRPPYSGFTGAHCNPVVCGRKHCTGCGRWRHAVDFFAHCRSPLQLASRCKTCARRQGRAVRRDPVRGPLRREYERIWREGQRRAAGVPERPGRRPPPDVGPSRGNRMVPIAPLTPFLEQWMNAHADEYRNGVNGHWQGIRGLAAASGVPERMLYSILSGHQVRCHYDVADRLAIAVGLSLTLIYGEP